jgi:hypothetical protein
VSSIAKLYGVSTTDVVRWNNLENGDAIRPGIGFASRVSAHPSSATDRAVQVKVEVRLFATLASFLPAHGRAGAASSSLPEGSTVTEVTRCLGIPA